MHKFSLIPGSQLDFSPQRLSLQQSPQGPLGFSWNGVVLRLGNQDLFLNFQGEDPSEFFASFLTGFSFVEFSFLHHRIEDRDLKLLRASLELVYSKFFGRWNEDQLELIEFTKSLPLPFCQLCHEKGMKPADLQVLVDWKKFRPEDWGPEGTENQILLSLAECRLSKSELALATEYLAELLMMKPELSPESLCKVVFEQRTDSQPAKPLLERLRGLRYPETSAHDQAKQAELRARIQKTKGMEFNWHRHGDRGVHEIHMKLHNASDYERVIQSLIQNRDVLLESLQCQ